MTTHVTSKQHPLVKLVRSLERRKQRDELGLVVLEGEDLLAAAASAGAVVKHVLVDADRSTALAGLGGVLSAADVTLCAPEVLAHASQLGHPPRVIAVVQRPEIGDGSDQALAAHVAASGGAWLLLDALGDPGNIGTCIRSAVAFGAHGVVALPGSADPWSGKALRASMGAAFSVPVGRVTGTGSDDLGAADFVSSVRELAPHVRVVALAGDATTRITDHPLPAAVLLVAGSERAGVSRAVRAVADDVVCIPQRPGVDSVNVGVAASIALHEWFRAHPHEEQQP